MTIRTQTEIKALFQTGDKPTQQDFEDFIDTSYLTEIAVKRPVRAVSTSNVSLTGLQTIDGVSLVADDLVLLTAQNTSSQNGVYTVASGAWSRTPDFSVTGDLVKGSVVPVTDGTSFAGTSWRVTNNNPIVPGTTNIAFARSPSGSFPAFTGNALSYARVNAAETAFEYRTPTDVASDISAVTQSGSTVTITYSDDTANVGPLVVLDRVSTNPAVNDQLGELRANGRDSGGNATVYGTIRGVIIDPSNGVEDGAYDVYALVNGSLQRCARFGQGLMVGTVTDPGTGIISAANGIQAGTGNVVTSFLTATKVIDFGNIVSTGAATDTITVTGASTGDTVCIGRPTGMANQIRLEAFVSSADTVTIIANNTASIAIDPASATYRVTVIKF